MSAAFTPFTLLDGLVAPLDRANVDTDAILPKQFMKSIQRTGFGDNLFDEWRYLDRGEPGQDCAARPRNEAFVLNQPRYQGAQVLLTRDNFGCGSSREHAPWALRDFGFRALIAPSFADIFYANCFKNGLLPVRLPAAEVQALFEQVQAVPGCRLVVDLQAQQVRTPQGQVFGFEVDAQRRVCLMQGLDDIELTLQHVDLLRAYEQRRRDLEPWIFDGAPAVGAPAA